MVFLILSVFLPSRPVLCVNEDFLENWLIEMCLDKILSFLELYQIIPWIIKNYWYISWNLHIYEVNIFLKKFYMQQIILNNWIICSFSILFKIIFFLQDMQI